MMSMIEEPIKLGKIFKDRCQNCESNLDVHPFFSEIFYNKKRIGVFDTELCQLCADKIDTEIDGFNVVRMLILGVRF